MLALLAEVERALPHLLDDDARWQTLDIDYEPPRVERAWTAFGPGRVSLHRIHPCERALFHPHPWPSAVWIVSGEYEMAVGYGKGDVEPPEAARCVLAAGSRYEMIHEDGWHSVRPIHAPSLSVMVTGQPWTRSSPGKDHDHAPLAPAAKRALLDDVRAAIRPRQ